MNTPANTPANTLVNTLAARTLERADVSDLIGLRVVVLNAAREISENGGETSIEIPDLEALSAAAALARALLPVRLRGRELRAIRHITRLTAAELAERMGDKTSPETISRWENEKQPMSGYAEKVYRLVMCEALRHRALGIGYEDGMIARMTLYDPWRADPGYEVPVLEFEHVRMLAARTQPPIEVWSAGLPRAA